MGISFCKRVSSVPMALISNHDYKYMMKLDRAVGNKYVKQLVDHSKRMIVKILHLFTLHHVVSVSRGGGSLGPQCAGSIIRTLSIQHGQWQKFRFPLRRQ